MAEEYDEEEFDEEEFHSGTFDESPFCPKYNDSMANVVIIRNTPKVPQDKDAKLKGVISKLVGKIGTPKTIEMPYGADNISLGFIFLEMETPRHADKVIEALNDYKLDKSHVFSVMSFQEFGEAMAVPDEYTPAAAKPFESTENLISWLTDEQARDQYVITHGQQSVGTTTEILWNNGRDVKPPLVSRKGWTESFVIWSPKGSYMLTMHQQGMALWGGESFKKLKKFAHKGAALVDFSPCERYLVSWSNTAREDNMIVWCLRSGTKIRGFTINQENIQWPMLKWSFDDNYCAREMEDGSIAVFELPSMQPACKRIKVEGSQGLCFSPAQPWISYWIPEQDNNPARVIIQEIPSKKEIKAKVLFNVAKCSFFWQTKGEYLAVQVDRVSKTGKTTYTNFELFRCADKEIPVEVLEFSNTIHGFAWEPKGTRFCVLAGDPPRLDVSFYTMGNRHEKQPQCTLLHKLEKKAVNEIRWSPKGTNVILAGLRTLNGQLEWWSCQDKELQKMGADEHFMCTDIEWDPTGRYVATSVQALRHNMENGYAMWTSQGRQLCKQPHEHFQKLHWRPRPKSLLTDKDEKSLMKNLRKYREQFEEIDNAIAAQALSAENEERRRVLAHFETVRREWVKKVSSQAAERADLRGYASEDEEYVEVDETREEVIEVDEEYMK